MKLDEISKGDWLVNETPERTHAVKVVSVDLDKQLVWVRFGDGDTMPLDPDDLRKVGG